MKSKLTTKQQEVVDLITKQFAELNESNVNQPFNVVDINLLSSELNAVTIARKELVIHNAAALAVHNAMIEKVVADMNADFAKAKFPIKAAVVQISDGYFIEVGYDEVISSGVSSSNLYALKVEMRTVRINEYIKHGLHDIGSKVVSFAYQPKWDSLDTDRVSTPQLYFARKDIQKRLVMLIERSMKVVNPKL